MNNNDQFGNVNGMPMEGHPQQQINIKPDDLTPIVCSCGNETFESGLKLGKISAIISPTGQNMIVPQEILMCKKCGEELNPEEI